MNRLLALRRSGVEQRRIELARELREYIKWMDMPPSTCNCCRSRFHRDFQQLCKEDNRNSDRTRFRTSTAPQNRSRNRYRSILCDEHTRVTLQDSSLEQTDDINTNRISGQRWQNSFLKQNDYINANRISGQGYHPGYIATQAPLPETMPHFWQMVFESGAHAIVMLTTESERSRYGQKKCDRYWPSLYKFSKFGSFLVENVGESIEHSVIERRFKINLIGTRAARSRNPSRYVVQLQITDWPDCSVPRSRRGLLHVLKKSSDLCRSTKYNKRSGPLVVHCSAGVGRTGTLIAIDKTYRRLREAYKNSSSPRSFRPEYFRDTVRCLKADRSKMVRTSEQYRFIFLVVLSAISR